MKFTFPHHMNETLSSSHVCSDLIKHTVSLRKRKNTTQQHRTKVELVDLTEDVWDDSHVSEQQLFFCSFSGLKHKHSDVSSTQRHLQDIHSLV